MKKKELLYRPYKSVMQDLSTSLNTKYAIHALLVVYTLPLNRNFIKIFKEDFNIISLALDLTKVMLCFS